jgi:hypothetical protein
MWKGAITYRMGMDKRQAHDPTHALVENSLRIIGDGLRGRLSEDRLATQLTPCPRSLVDHSSPAPPLGAHFKQPQRYDEYPPLMERRWHAHDMLQTTVREEKGEDPRDDERKPCPYRTAEEVGSL